MDSLWSVPLGWALSCAMLLVPGFSLAKMLFPKKHVEAIDLFLSSLVLGSALTTLPPTILGTYLKGFPSLYAIIILPTFWVVIAVFFLLGVADKRIKLGWNSGGIRTKALATVRIDSLEKLMFVAVPLFSFLYFVLNIFVDTVGWTAAGYYLPLAQMIYRCDVIPAYDPYLNLGEPVAQPPFPSPLYSTLFFQLSDTDFHALAFLPLLFGLGCTLCVYALARRFLDGRTAALSAVIFTATPLFMKLFSFSYLYSADLFALFFFSAAVYTYYLALKEGSRGMAVVSGLSSCLAILSRSYCLYTLPLTLLLLQALVSGKRKQQVLLTILIMLSTAVAGILVRGEVLLVALGILIMAAMFLFRPTADRDDLGKGLQLSLIVLALFSLGLPWYLRNFMLFGDPVYPQLSPLFHTSPLSDTFIGQLFQNVSAVYWKPMGESAHVGSVLSTVLVPFLSFDFGVFLFVFKVAGFQTLLRGKTPVSSLLSPWMAVSYVTWLLLFNYSANYLVQILPPLSIVCAIGMTVIYEKLNSLVGAVRKEKPILVLTTVFSLFGYYLLYYLSLKGLLPEVLSSLSASVLYLNPTPFESVAFSLFPFLIASFALVATMIKGRWRRPPQSRFSGRTRNQVLIVVLAALFLTTIFYVAPSIIGFSEEAALGGIFSQGEAHELATFIEHNVPQEAVIVSLTPEVMRMLLDCEVVYFFTPKGMLELKNLLNISDEALIIDALRARGFIYFIVPEPTGSANSTDAAIYKVAKAEMIYNSYLYLAQRFRVFSLVQEGGCFMEVFSNGLYAVYQLL